MGERMRRKDWSATPLGPPAEWPQSLKTAVRIVLTSRQPMFVWWGADLINLYNDAYKNIVRGKHPEALGQPASVVWREIWDQIHPRVESVMRRNEGTYDEAMRLIMVRNGYPEETYYTFSYSPVPNDEGGAGGIFCANSDDTQRIIGERQLALLRELAASTADARTFSDACASSARALATNPYDVPFAMIYLVEPGQHEVRLYGATGIPHGHAAAPEHALLDGPDIWPFAAAIREHETCVVSLESIPGLPAGAWGRASHQAVAVPLAASGAAGRAGMLIAGLNPYRLFDDNYRRFIELVAGQISAGIGNAQAYEEERKRAESLAELDRAKTTFFSNVSHEFRTPLTLMLGPMEDVLSENPDELAPAHREMLSVAHRNGRRLLKLVNTLLDFSRIEAGRVEAAYEPTDIAAYTADLASVFRAAVEKAGLELRIDCPSISEPAFVDRDMWEKIVLNLISNAFKYTLEGTISVVTRRDGQNVVLTVSDTGTGIPPEELPRLFDRFHRVQGARGRTHEGTGIGLALVQELVRLHGGQVTATSVVDHGTTFTVTVPLGSGHLPPERVHGTRMKPSATAGSESFVEEALRWLPHDREAAFQEVSFSTGQSGILLRSRSAERTRPRVLLADDNADMRDYVRRLLSNDYEVVVVPDGRAALDSIVENAPDLVLTDVMMPQLDGFGLLRELRNNSRTASIPVIMLSARAGEESRVEGLQAGADDYLVKPFSARELLARVKGTLALARLRNDAQKREEELRAESANILENITEGFLACDANWRISYLNREAERVTGNLRGDLLGKDFWEAFPDVAGTMFEPAFRRAMRERVSIQIEDFYEPSGRWFEVHLVPVGSGGLAFYFRDVTEQKLSKTALRESEARFSRFMQHLPGLAWIKDDRGRYVFANEAAMRAFGRTSEELYGRTDREIFPDRTASEFFENDLQALRSESGIQTEETLTHPDGSVHHSIVNKFSIPGASGNSSLIGGMAIDITERKKAESALRESEARFRHMADNAPVLIWVNGPDGCEFVNREYLRFLGRPFEEVRGMNWTQFLHPDDAENYVNTFFRAKRRQEPFEEQMRFRRHDGEYRWLRSAGVPRIAEDGALLGYVGCSFDITEIKRSEETLREADRRKDEFLAMLAHELRNPLAPIRNGLDLLAAQGVQDEALDLMRDQVEHVVRMVDDLLDASRILRNRVQLRRKPVELSAIVQRALESVRPHIEAQQHEVTISYPPAPVWVDADPVRLIQVVSNLLHNAAKYTERNGRIVVEIREQDGRAVFSVRDSGVGISPALLPHIFELFTQADRSLERSQGGLGIGLTLVKSLVELHGGRVEAHSDGEGQGAEFVVDLPAITGRQTEESSAVPAAVGRDLRILVVEDNVGSAKILARLLSTLGDHEIHLAHDGIAGLEKAREKRPELILLDIGLPRMNGFDVAHQLRSDPQFDRMLLVALTGYGADDDRRRSREAGFDMHLVKPLSLDVLQQLLTHPKLVSRE